MSEARSVVWLTVSKALEMSRDTVTVRCSGSCWLKKGGGGRAVGAEAVLGVGQWKAAEFWEQKAFQNFDYGEEEGDGAIAAAKVCGFCGFEEGDDNC